MLNQTILKTTEQSDSIRGMLQNWIDMQHTNGSLTSSVPHGSLQASKKDVNTSQKRIKIKIESENVKTSRSFNLAIKGRCKPHRDKATTYLRSFRFSSKGFNYQIDERDMDRDNNV